MSRDEKGVEDLLDELRSLLLRTADAERGDGREWVAFCCKTSADALQEGRWRDAYDYALTVSRSAERYIALPTMVAHLIIEGLTS